MKLWHFIKCHWAIPEQIQTGGWGWGYTFLKIAPGNFRFVTLLQEILERKSFYSWKFCKFVWHPLKIPKSETKTHGNSALIFVEHPWNFHFFFNWPLEFPHVFSSRPPEIPCPQLLLFVFFLDGIAHCFTTEDNK